MARGIGAWWDAHKPTKRRLIQVYAAALYNAHLKGFVRGEIYTGGAKAACLPGLNCYSCPGAVGACPLGALQNALASTGNRAPFYVLGIFLLYGLTLGRTVCGWLCPMGLLQEMLHKLPTPKIPKNRFTRALSYLKYALLAIFVVLIPLAYAAQYLPLPAFCKYICPAGTLEGAIGLLANPVNAPRLSMLNILFTQKFIIMVVVFTACVFVYRAFCRFLCPLGAIYGMFSRIAVVGVKVEPTRCTGCGRCVSRCRMDIRRVGDHECISCGECVDACAAKAICLKAGKITLMEHAPDRPQGQAARGKTRGRVMWVAALVVLAGALLAFNWPQEERAAAPVFGVVTEPAQSDTPEGNAVGMRCADFTAPLYGGAGEFSLSGMRGKPVVINFWATWCAPCLKELPFFQQLHDEYGDSIGLVAIHSNMVTDDVQAWLDRQDYTMPFAFDETGGVLDALGDPMMLPVTVVLDGNGIIVYNQSGSVTYELLASLIEPLL